MTSLSKQEYLQKYISKPKKKIKKQASVKAGLRIVELDISLKHCKSNLLEENEHILYPDDAPAFEVVDERPAHLKDGQRWKSFENNKSNQMAACQGFRNPALLQKKIQQQSDFIVSSPSQKKHSDASPQRQQCNSNASPLKPRQQHDSDASPPRPQRQRHDSYVSPLRPQRQRHDSDASPLRPQTQRQDSDASPPRPQRHRLDSDASPPWQRMRHDSDALPPRQKKRHDSDASPPRQRKRHDSDASPPRPQTQQQDSDASPPRPQRHRYDSDASPPRQRKRHNSDASPQRRSKRHDSLASPPIPQKQQHDSNTSPRQIQNRHDSPLEKRPTNHRNGKSSNTTITKQSFNRETLSGRRAGLSAAEELRRELEEEKRKKMDAIDRADPNLTGKGATTVLRGKLRKQEIDPLAQKLAKEHEAQVAERHAVWGRGTVQSQTRDARLEEDLHELNKPLARYRNDEDLDKLLRERIHEEDPMANYIRKKRATAASSETNSGGAQLPQYNGPAPAPNRFGITPGYRWDGVDRGNAFEKRFFQKQNQAQALQDEAYKWSTEDM